MHLGYGAWQLEPTLGLSAISFASSSLAEGSGGSLGETIAGQSTTSLQSLAALRVGTQFAVTPAVPLQVHALVGWQHEYLDVSTRTTATLAALGSGPFSVASSPLSRDAARLGAGFDVTVSPAVNLYGSYQAALGADTTAQYLTGGVRFTW